MRLFIADEQRKIRLSRAEVERVTKKISKILHLAEDSSLSITFCSKPTIKRLNKKYFGKDAATDVIAFEYKNTNRPPYKNYLGDIVICPAVCLENSRLYNNTFFRELSLYIIHGILHLLGYDDTTKKSRLSMQHKEKQILEKI